jgi:hypothetical protein
MNQHSADSGIPRDSISWYGALEAPVYRRSANRLQIR